MQDIIEYEKVKHMCVAVIESQECFYIWNSSRIITTVFLCC